MSPPPPPPQTAAPPAPRSPAGRPDISQCPRRRGSAPLYSRSIALSGRGLFPGRAGRFLKTGGKS